MLYSRKIVLALSACVVLASGSMTLDEVLTSDSNMTLANADAMVEAADSRSLGHPLHGTLDDTKAAAVWALAFANRLVLRARQADNEQKDENTKFELKKAEADYILTFANAELNVLKAETRLSKQDDRTDEIAAKDRVMSARLGLAAVRAEKDLAGHKSHLAAVKKWESNQQGQISLQNFDYEEKIKESEREIEELFTLKRISDSPADPINVITAAKMHVDQAKKALDAHTERLDSPQSWDNKPEFKDLDEAKLHARLKGAEAVLKALERAEQAKLEAEQVKETLTTVTKNRDILEAENTEHKKRWFQKLWDFVKRPKTLYDQTRSNTLADGKTLIDSSIPKGQAIGPFATIKHMFWPSSKGGKIAYATGAATIAAGVVGGFKYAEHRKDQRTSESRKKWGLAAAGLAATGAAAFGGYKAWEAYQAKQQPDEHLDEEGELQTSEKNDSQAVDASSGGESKAKNGKKPKGSNWMIWVAVIVLGLALIGGALYYFLFLNEEESVEDAVPEGEDRV